MKFFPFSFFITGYQSQTVEYPSQNIYLKSCSKTTRRQQRFHTSSPPVGGRENLRTAEPAPPPQQRLRIPDRHKRSYDKNRHDRAYAASSYD